MQWIRLWTLLLLVLAGRPLAQASPQSETGTTEEVVGISISEEEESCSADPGNDGTSSTSTSTSSSLVVLCTADGSLLVLDAWKGTLVSASSAGPPLLTRSVANSAGSNGKNNNEGEESLLVHHIVPGLDGKLYWQEHIHTDDEKSQQTPVLQTLPVSIPSLLAHPVRTCTPQDENDNARQSPDCGILHAVQYTALLGLHPQSGKVQWKSSSSSTTTGSGNFHNNTDTCSSEYTPNHNMLILQRKDVALQQVSTRTGQQIWNITMGSYQAVDFDGTTTASSSSSTSSLLDDDDDLDNNEPPEVVSKLPLLAFLQEGTQLVAIDHRRQRPADGDKNTNNNNADPVLWRMETPQKVAAVFGILEGQWHPVHTLDGFFDAAANDGDGAFYNQKVQPLLLAAQEENDSHDNWLDEWMSEKWIKEEMFRMYYEKTSHPPRRGAHGVVQGLLPAPLDDNQHVMGQAPHYFLELPQAPPVSTLASPPPNGLVLSWEVAHAVALGLAALGLVGFALYRRQKQLLRRAQWRVNIAEAARRNPPQESQSLPGEVVNKGTVTYPVQSDPGHVLTSGSDTLPNKTSGSEDIVPQEEEQQGVIQQGGIPLVRYARFRSEFEQLQALGSGGFGSVFRCRNNLDGREYAIKKVSIRRRREDDTTFNQRLQRVLREVKILAALDHPNIVRYYTAWLEVESGVEDETERADDGGTSQGYSSSYLTNEASRSVWEQSMNRHRGRRPHQYSVDNSKTESGDLCLPRMPRHRTPLSGEDLGFIFEESNEPNGAESATPETNSSVGHVDALPSKNGLISAPAALDNSSPDSPQIPLTDEQEFNQRHTLYIQMHLCSFDNLSDFLANPEARKGGLCQGIDIALALRLFLQISRAVQYVHAQNMIHRDLKPTNCFVDETGQIKVGDFGLSRESGDRDGTNIIETPRAGGEDQTAGVGTRLYASPEQSAGTSYDSSTDVFSLGIILFELCYPMYTGMERNICISRLRDKHEFPSDWDAIVSSSFPTLRQLLLSMLSLHPEDRPKASTVADHIQEVLGELTIISITNEDASSENMILLRVEADSDPDTLANTMGQIRQAAHPGNVDILQYGLAQSKDSHTIMEFALRSSPEVEASLLVSRLKQRPRILTARQVSVSSQ